MIDGLLMITVNPAYASFWSKEHDQCGKNCTIEELRALLIDLGALSHEQPWPPREYILRISGQFSSDTLAKFGLIRLAAVQPISKPERVSMRLTAS